jgi:hypothetical protein
MQDLARRSPNALLNMLGIPNDKDQGRATKTSQQVGGHQSSVNTDAMGLGDSPSRGTTRDNAYYDKLKQEMGISKFVMDRKLQIQMHKDMSQLGEAFFSE